MSTDCCDFDICNRGRDCPAGSVVAEKLLVGETLPGLMTYDDAQKQWRRSDFTPLYNHLHTENSDGSDPEADEPWLSGQRVLISVLLAAVVATAIAVLLHWRPL